MSQTGGRGRGAGCPAYVCPGCCGTGGDQRRCDYTGYAAVQRSGASLTDTIVVLGCGPVGLMALLCVSGFGVAIAVDSIEARRELAASLGAEAVSPAEAEELVLARTGGLGADVVIEAAGTPGALDAALQLARGRGTVSVVVRVGETLKARDDLVRSLWVRGFVEQALLVLAASLSIWIGINRELAPLLSLRRGIPGPHHPSE